MVSGTRSLSVSRYQPMSRICWRVRSRVRGKPLLMNGSISRFGSAALL